MPDKLNRRQFILLAILASVGSLGYFHLLDRAIFSSKHFAPIFRVLLTVHDAKTAWLSAAVCFLAALWHWPNPFLALVDWLSGHVYVVVAASVAVLSLGSIFAYRSHPFSMDEYAAVFQSKIFASGHLYAQLPPSVVDWLVMPGFNGPFLIASRVTGKAIESYWPGFALLLAPFELLGVPWLCNSLLAGLALYLVYRITAHITGDQRAAGWAMLFTLGSGAFAANAISYYSMQAHLTANLLFAWLLIKPSPRRALAAGLVGSWALVLHNPFPHSLFAAPWILAMAWEKNQRHYLVPLIVGYLPGLAVGLGWLWLRADIAPVAHNISAVSGVGRGVFVLPDSVLIDMRVASIAKMWIWAVPGLFLLALLGCVRERRNHTVRILTQSAALTFIGYLFVRLDQGHGWGYRYFHSAWGVVPILGGCAMVGNPNGRLASFAGATAILSLLVILPFQLWQIEGIIAQHLSQIPPPRRPGSNVYFIQPGGGWYMSDMAQIDPQLRGQDLLLASRGTNLDSELVRQNWPNAVKVGDDVLAQQWYLGPVDQRRFSIAFARSDSHAGP